MPRAWGNDRIALWNSLSEEVREQAKDLSASQERYFREQQSEFIKQREEFAKDNQAAQQIRAEHERWLVERSAADLSRTMREKYNENFPGMDTKGAAEKLAKEDPAKFAVWKDWVVNLDAMGKATAAITQKHDGAHAQALELMQNMQRRAVMEQQHAAQQQHQTWIAEQDAEFERRVPEMRDADKAERLQKEARRYLTETLNLKRDEINDLWNNSALRSATGQQMLLDASRWRAAEREARAALAKQPPKPQTPGTSALRIGSPSSALAQAADRGDMNSYVTLRAQKGSR